MTERREATRYPLRLPVELDVGAGHTLNMSATGILFEFGQALPMGCSVQLEILLPALGDVARRLRCLGKVVRLEPRDESYGVGLELVDTAFVC
jgi:hypothetical protein